MPRGQLTNVRFSLWRRRRRDDVRERVIRKIYIYERGNWFVILGIYCRLAVIIGSCEFRQMESNDATHGDGMYYKGILIYITVVESFCVGFD